MLSMPLVSSVSEPLRRTIATSGLAVRPSVFSMPFGEHQHRREDEDDEGEAERRREVVRLADDEVADVVVDRGSSRLLSRPAGARR